MKVFLVGGARPNFMKIAPIYREALQRPKVDSRIVHTGQHYDYEMSDAFFDDLGIPMPLDIWGCSYGGLMGEGRPPSARKMEAGGTKKAELDIEGMGFCKTTRRGTET